MDRDSYVKRLDFEDVALSPSTMHSLAAASECSMDVTDDPPSLENLRDDALRVRENLASSGTLLYDFAHEFQQKVQREAEEAGKEDCSAEQNKTAVSMLGDEYLELLVKEGILKRIAGWKIGDDNSQDGSAFTNETDPDDVGDQLTELRNANAEAILEIESLIKTISDDVNGFENDLSTEYHYLDACDQEAAKLEAEESTVACLDVDANGLSTVVSKQSESLQDLESTIQRLEETLKQNESDYVQAEAAMENRIEQYNREIEELQAPATQLNREEQCMRMLIHVAAGFLRSQRHMKCSNDVLVVKVEGGLDLQLTTHVHNGDGRKDTTEEAKWKHSLQLKIDGDIMQEARLLPEDVPIDDIVAEAQGRSIAAEAQEPAQEGEAAKFGPQVAFVVKKVQERLNIHLSKLASLSISSSDPRYRVEHMPGTSVICVTTPGRLKALVDIQ